MSQTHIPQERKLIIAMRNVDAQLNKYEVFVITRNFPDGYQIEEYHDIFETIPISDNIGVDSDVYEFYDVTISDGQVYYDPNSYMRNKITHETYTVMGDK